MRVWSSFVWVLFSITLQLFIFPSKPIIISFEMCALLELKYSQDWVILQSCV